MSDPILYVISGAGLSAESGVPTFRTAGGLWEQVDKNRVCNFYTWKRYRDEVFQFYWRWYYTLNGWYPSSNK